MDNFSSPVRREKSRIWRESSACGEPGCLADRSCWPSKRHRTIHTGLCPSLLSAKDPCCPWYCSVDECDGGLGAGRALEAMPNSAAASPHAMARLSTRSNTLLIITMNMKGTHKRYSPWRRRLGAGVPRHCPSQTIAGFSTLYCMAESQPGGAKTLSNSLLN